MNRRSAIRTILFLAVLAVLPNKYAIAAEIHDAVAKGDIKSVQQLLERDPSSLNARNVAGWTPLFFATNKLDMTNLLLSHGANPNARDTGQRTPLYYARTASVASALLASGAEVNLRDNVGMSPLHWSATGLKQEGTWVDPGVAKVLLAHGASLEAKDNMGQTPLHKAAFYGYIQLIAIFIDAGAAVEAKDFLGETPLHLVAHRYWPTDRDQTMEALSKFGANPNAADDLGQTPLHAACQAVCADSIDWLISHGGSVNARDNTGKTPLRDLEEQIKISEQIGNQNRKAEALQLVTVLKSHGATD